MRIFSLFVVAVSIAGVAAVQAMPVNRAHMEMTIPVSSGCGIGVHRGPYGECHHSYNGYYRGYNDGYYDGFHDGSYRRLGRSRIVDQGSCSGRRMHRVCNAYGECWLICK